MSDDHDCTAHAYPVFNGVDGESGVSKLSATVVEDGVVVFMTCSECGKNLDAQYSYETTQEYTSD